MVDTSCLCNCFPGAVGMVRYKAVLSVTGFSSCIFTTRKQSPLCGGEGGYWGVLGGTGGDGVAIEKHLRLFHHVTCHWETIGWFKATIG